MNVMKANSSAVARASKAAMALILVVLFAAGFAIIYSSSRIMHAELQGVNDSDLSVMQTLYNESGFDALVLTIKERTQGAPELRQLIGGVFAADGTYLAGDLKTMEPLQGNDYVSIPLSDGTIRSHVSKSIQLPEGTVFIGRPVDIIEATLRNLLIILPLTALALIATLILATQFAAKILGRQLDRIEGTLNDFSFGNEFARVALGPDLDDRFYDVSVSINENLEFIAQGQENLKNTTIAIAHDLRTPLTRASLAIQVAGSDKTMSDEMADNLDRAGAELAALSVTFDTILRISNISNSLSEATFTNFALNDLLIEITESYEAVFEDAGYRLTPPLEGSGLAMIRADRSMITQLVINLLKNVMTHCPLGTVAGLEIEAGRNGVALVVFDNGPGVPPSQLTQIF